MAPYEPLDPYERPALRPSSVGEVIRGILADRRLSPGMSLGRLATSWSSVVGDSLARVTSPRSLENGVLTVAAETSAWAAQVSFLADEIGRKANAALDSEPVREVRVVVGKRTRKSLRRNG